MRVLGIDCGTERTGFGVIESDGRAHQLITYGVIRTSPRNPMPARISEIAQGLRKVIAEYSPQAAAIEEVFTSVNSKSALKLAQVRGVAMLVAHEASLSIGEYSPLAIKASVVGYGRAEKSQVQLMVRTLLRLEDPIQSNDAADALAVAICHVTHS